MYRSSVFIRIFAGRERIPLRRSARRLDNREERDRLTHARALARFERVTIVWRRLHDVKSQVCRFTSLRIVCGSERGD